MKTGPVAYKRLALLPGSKGQMNGPPVAAPAYQKRSSESTRYSSIAVGRQYSGSPQLLPENVPGIQG